LTIGKASGTNAYGGAIGNATNTNLTTQSNNIAVVKVGGSSQELLGVSTYALGTTLNAGTLIISGNQSLGTGGVTVNGSLASTLQFSTSTTVANNITFTSTNASSVVLVGTANGTAFRTGTTGTFKSQFAGGDPDTAASFLGGTNTSGGVATVAMRFSDISAATNDSSRISDVFSLTGTSLDIYVLQLSVTGLSATDYMGWLDGTNEWVTATVGNTGAGSLAGFYTDSFSTFVTNNGGSFNPLTMLGAYGNDGAGNVWAVLNHNSDFAVIPEPSTWALIGLGSAFLLHRSRRRRA
jgi:hypothetical protein